MNFKRLLIGILAFGAGIQLPQCIPAPAWAVVTNQATETVTTLGNGVTTNYTIGFDFRDNSQVAVFLNDLSTTPITITPVLFGSGLNQFLLSSGNPATTVIMQTAPTTTQFLVIERSLPITQPVMFQYGAPFPVTSLGLQLDEQAMMIQDIQQQVNGSLQVQPGASPVPTQYLPNCVTGTFLTSTNGSITCGGVAGINGGTVTGVTGTAPIIVTSSTGVPNVSVVYKAPTHQLLVNGTSYTTPTNPVPLYLKITLIGGGGQGGGSANIEGPAGGGGGGSGGGVVAWINSPTTSYSYVIGQGGTTGAGAANGQAGTATTFNAGAISAGGGAGGIASTNAVSAPGAPGAGGAVSGGTINVPGSYGTYGIFGVSGIDSGIGGTGGSPPFGMGASGNGISGGTGNPGTGYGAGGPGAASTFGIGTSGTNGLIIVEEFYQ